MELVQMLSVAGYIAAQLLADILSLKIALIGSFSIDAGTFIYPFTFTLRDLIHKSLGKKMARMVIITAGLINIIMALLLQFTIWLKPDPTWPFQNEFATILGPVWRIVFASIIAEIVSELIDTEAYSFWIRKITTRHQWSRVLFSNALAIPVDSVIFALIAFYGALPLPVIISILFSNIIVKGVTTIASIPLIYLSKTDRKE